LLKQHGRWFTAVSPGARIAGRTQKARVYKLTAYPTPTNTWKLAIWRDFHTHHSDWAIAGEEEAPTTGRIHQHWVFRLTDTPETTFIMHIFPEFHYEGIPEDAPRRIQSAIEYAIKGGNNVFQNGAVPQPLPAVRRTESDLRWEEILRLTEAGEMRQVRNLFPKEYARNFTHLEMLAARAAFTRRPRETLEDGELLRKNIYICGRPSNRHHLGRSSAVTAISPVVVGGLTGKGSGKLGLVKGSLSDFDQSHKLDVSVN
jgi:hypothetical protein